MSWTANDALARMGLTLAGPALEPTERWIRVRLAAS